MNATLGQWLIAAVILVIIAESALFLLPWAWARRWRERFNAGVFRPGWVVFGVGLFFALLLLMPDAGLIYGFPA